MSEARFMTMRHIETVRNYLAACIRELLTRQEQHDQSKLESPEVEGYDALTFRLRGLTYGSQAYLDNLKDLQSTIEHHYACNRHHMEYHAHGYRDMTLIDLLEVLCDWQSACLRHADGSIYKSLDINQQRYGYSDELKQILHNTAEWLLAQPVYHKAHES